MKDDGISRLVANFLLRSIDQRFPPLVVHLQPISGGPPTRFKLESESVDRAVYRCSNSELSIPKAALREWLARSVQ